MSEDAVCVEPVAGAVALLPGTERGCPVLLAVSLVSVENKPAVSTLMSVERREESRVLAAALRMELGSTDICAGVMESTPVCRRAIDKMSPMPPPPLPPLLLPAAPTSPRPTP